MSFLSKSNITDQRQEDKANARLLAEKKSAFHLIARSNIFLRDIWLSLIFFIYLRLPINTKKNTMEAPIFVGIHFFRRETTFQHVTCDDELGASLSFAQIANVLSSSVKNWRKTTVGCQ